MKPNINEIWQLDKVVAAMKEHFNSARTDHAAIAKTYYNNVLESVRSGLIMAKAEQYENDLIPVSFHDLKKMCGRYGKKGNNQNYWFYWFQESPFALLNKIEEGYRIGTTGKLTMASTTFDIKILLASQDSYEVFKGIYGVNSIEELQTTYKLDCTPIDMISLDNYIKSNRSVQERFGALDKNLEIARSIWHVAEYCGGFLPQIVNESKFGRRYYKGLNLQTASRMVREAALGQCHAYDIEASVFTWKFDFVKSLYEIKLPYTIDYLDKKTYHRERLAMLVYGSKEKGYVEIIKRAMTAIGFGAKSGSQSWKDSNGRWQRTALREIIKAPDRLAEFKNDSFVAGFLEEQEVMNQLIWNEMKDHPGVVNNKDLCTDKGRISKNRAIAMLYQRTERQIVDALCEASADKEVLLRCHDGFYTRHKADLADIRYRLKQFTPNGKLEYKVITRYSFADRTLAEEHKRHMENEERDARMSAYDQGKEYKRGNGKLPFMSVNRESEGYFNGQYLEPQDYSDMEEPLY